MNDTELYKAQIAKLISTLEEFGTGQQGLKRAVMDILGTLNHRIRSYIERREYVARLTGSYVSPAQLKHFDRNIPAADVLAIIQQSDKANIKPKISIKILARRAFINFAYAIYTIIYALLRLAYRAAKSLLKRRRDS